MTAEAEAQAIESRFNTNWAARTPIKWDNVDYVPTPGTTYVSVIIDNAAANIIGLGGSDNLYRTRGFVSINIHSALNEGTRSGRVLADAAAGIFRGAEFSGIVCSAPMITRIGKVEDWFVYNVTVPFYRNEFH